MAELTEQILMQLHGCHGMSRLLHVGTKDIEHARGGGGRPGQRTPQVKQVPALPALIQCPHLRRQQLRQCECRDVGFPGEPPALNPEGRLLQRVHEHVFTAVDFHLQTQRH